MNLLFSCHAFPVPQAKKNGTANARCGWRKTSEARRKDNENDQRRTESIGDSG